MARILLVEDDAALSRGIIALLRAAGHAADSAEDGETALMLARSEPYGLLILDIGSKYQGDHNFWDYPFTAGIISNFGGRTRMFGNLAGMDTVVFTATYADIPRNLPLPETFRGLLRSRFAAANEALAEITRASGALCLDVTAPSQWADPAFWAADGLHPSPLGHRHFAEGVAGLLERVAGVPVLAASAPTS